MSIIDKMLRIAGRSSDGKARAIRADIEGNLGVELKGKDVATGLQANPSFETDTNGYGALRITDATPYAYDEFKDKLKVETSGYDESVNAVNVVSKSEFHTTPQVIFPKATRTESPTSQVIEVPKDVKGFMLYAIVEGSITGDFEAGGYSLGVTGQLGSGGTAFQWFDVSTDKVKVGNRNLVIQTAPQNVEGFTGFAPYGNAGTVFIPELIPTHLRIRFAVEGVFEEGQGVPSTVMVRWLR